MIGDSNEDGEFKTTSMYPGGNQFLKPFAGYVVETNETGAGFYCFVFVYTLLALVLIAPLVKWSRYQEENKIKQLEQEDDEPAAPPEGMNEIPSIHDLPTPLATNSSSEDMMEKQEKPNKLQKKLSGTSQSRISTSRRSEYSSSKNRSMRKQSSAKSLASKQSHKYRSPSVTTTGSRSTSALRSVVLRELDQSYPDQDPDFQMVALRNNNGNSQHPPSHLSKQQQHQTGNGSKAPTETSSGVPSAATTSKVFLQNPTIKKNFSKQVLDVSGRRWKTRRPIGRVDVIQNAVANELSSLASGGDGASAFMATKRNVGKSAGSFVGPNGKKIGSVTSNNSKLKPSSGSRLPQYSRQRGMSDVASSILSEQHHQLNQQPNVQVDISVMKRHRQLQEYHLQQLQLQQQHPFAMHRLASLQRQQQHQRYSHAGRRSSRSGRSVVSERSAMSSIVDDISPNDAADANDPGRGNVFVEPEAKYLGMSQKGSYNNSSFGIKAGCCSAPFESLLSLAVFDEDKQKVLLSSIPLTLGACSEATFRLITAAFISQYLGTASMVAFLLVGLFVRLTSEELTDAIIDALSAFIQASLYAPSPPGQETDSGFSGANSYLAGQYVQLAFLLQLFLNVPLLFAWVVSMEQVVLWFVNSPTIAAIAKEYAFVVVFAYLMQSLTRTLTVTFHICGHDHFESVIDIFASTLQLVSIACVVALVEGATLRTVGYVQVLITFATAISKVLFPVMRGWMQPFRKGLIQNFALLQNKSGIWHLLKATGPLLLGTILEYSEWELLTIFIRHLGPAEVATWALLGAIWDVLEAFTEGIGEAAANQVAFLLSVGFVNRARNLSNGVLFVAVVHSLILSSILYISGQYLAVLFSEDATIQHLTNNSIVMIGIANVLMAFAQISWSIVGAQGRFRLATMVMFLSRWFVSMPCALISIYAFYLDLNAVGGSLVVGYATAASALTFIALRSDWERLSDTMQDISQPLVEAQMDGEDNDEVGGAEQGLGFVDLDDFDDSPDSDSDGF